MQSLQMHCLFVVLLLNKLIVTRVRVCSLVFWFCNKVRVCPLVFRFCNKVTVFSLLFWFCKVLKLSSEKHNLLLACANFLHLLF